MPKKIFLIFLFNAGLLTFLFLANTEIPSTKPLISQSQPPNTGISTLPSKETIAENARNHAINHWRFPQSGRVVRIEATNLRTMGDIRWISATIPKWKITLESTDLRLVYITNDTGAVMVLAKRDNLPLLQTLPPQVIAAVQKAAVFYWNPQIETTPNPLLPTQVFLEKAEPATWQNTCLDLPNSGENCSPKTITGWRIEIVGIPPIPCTACLPGNSWQIAPPTLNFRIDDTGKEVRADIPKSVAAEGFKVAESWGLATKSGRIVGASPTRWGSGCDGFQGLPIACDPVPVSGWLLKIEDRGKRWHSRVDNSGNNGELMARENMALDNSFDKKLADEVRNLAAQHLQIGQEQILFTKVEAQTFGACLGLPTPVEKCAPDSVEGYRVTVEGKVGQQQVYRISPNSGIRTEANHGLPSRIDKLPNPIAEKVFMDAKSRLQVTLSDLRITSSEITSECFRTPTDAPNAPCQVLVSGGWQIVVTDFKQQLVYRVNSRGHIESVSPE